MRSDILMTGLISERDIREALATIFPDSIIVKNNSVIIGVSSSIADTLGYEVDELVGRSADILSKDPSLATILKREFTKGFFNDRLIKLHTKDSTGITFSLSGFLLGLISDINDIAIIKARPVETDVHQRKLLEDSRIELDEFVYRTTHDLRGPLATMQGLMNLMKFEIPSNANSLKNIVEMLERSARTLDARLSNLNYLAENVNPDTINFTLDCAEAESFLRSTLELNLKVNSVDFKFATARRYYEGVNAQLVTSMLNHLLLYLIGLPISSDPRIVCSIQLANPGVRVTIYAEGFLSNHHLRQVLQHKNPLYTAIVMYSDLVNFFAAMKNAQRIDASIHVDFIEDESQQIVLIIPLHPPF
jgi:signal transduction histidine kinase